MMDQRSDVRSQACLYWLAVVTALVGTLVALAPHTSPALLPPLLVGGLMSWTVAATMGLYGLLRSSLGNGVGTRGRFVQVLGWLGGVGIVLAVIACSQLWVVRVVWDREALIWNVDWRAALSHAQAIARFGDLSHSLEYSGQPIQYHVGPGWIAGYFERVFGFGIEGILFGLLPALAVTAALGGLAMILSGSGVGWPLAVASAGLVVLVPASQVTPLRLARHPQALLDADTWSFGAGVMSNSSFGLAVGLSSLVLVLHSRRHWWGLPLGALSLAATIVLKPQYFAGLGLLVGVSGLAWLARDQLAAPRPAIDAPGFLSVRWIWASVVFALAVLGLLPFVASSVGTTLGLAICITAYAAVLALTLVYGVRPARAGSVGSLAAAAVALMVAIALFATTPGHPAIFAGPVVAPGNTGWSDYMFGSTAIMLFLTSTAACAAVPHPDRGAESSGCLALGWLALIAAASLSVGLQVLSFPVWPDLVEHALLLQMDRWDPTSGQAPLSEALEPLLLLVATCSIGAIVTRTAAARRPLKIGLVACVSTASLLFAAFIAMPTLRPERGYEAVEDAGLRSLLQRIPIEGSLLVSSDIADSAQDYQRPAFAPLLSAYFGHTTYTSELLWLNWVRPDAPVRLQELRWFFGSTWSPWHGSWLARNGITHVLVSDRCQPTWWREPPTALVPAGRAGQWTVFRVLAEPSTEVRSPPQNWADMAPMFGKTECLVPARRGDSMRAGRVVN